MAHDTIHYAIGTCALGHVLVARSAAGLCAIALGDAEGDVQAELQRHFPQAALSPSVAADVAHVVACMERNQHVTAPLDLRGTAFQQRVWQELRDIAPGRTVTYAQIAQQIGQPQAVRAVAGACAANKLAVIIPCHRVVKSDGALSGYRWGVARKQALLERERAWACAA